MVSSVIAAEVEDFMPYENSKTYSLPSAEETVAPLREMREDIDLIASLLSDEKTVVEDLFGTLLRIVGSMPRVPLDPSIFEEQLGKVEEAHVSPEGMFVYGLSDGLIGSLSLSEDDKRDLLVKVVKAIIPTLRGILDGSVVLEEPEEPWTEPPVEPTIEELPEEEAKVEPEFHVEEPPEVSEPDSEEQDIEEEPMEEPPEELSTEEEPRPEELLKTEPEYFEEPEQIIPVDLQEELPEPPEPQEQEIVEMQPPKPLVKNLKDPHLGGLRRKVQREREYIRRQMQQIRRLRATKISQLREATGKTVTMTKKPRSQGLFGQMKNIVSSLFRKR
jgi:hypothetical protein